NFTEHAVRSDADHTGTINEARIDFDRPLPAHASVVINVQYTVKIAHSSERLRPTGAPLQAALRTDWDRISPTFTAARGVGYVLWYPVALEPASLAEGNTVFESVSHWRAREQDSDFVLNIEDGTRKAQKSYAPLGMSTPVLTGIYEPSLLRNSVAVVSDPSVSGALAFSNEAERFAEAWLPPRTVVAKIWGLPESGDVPFSSATETFASPTIDPQDAQSLSLYAVEHAALKSNRPWIQEGYAAFLDVAWREHSQGRDRALSFLEERRGALALGEPEDANTAETSLINSSEESRYRMKAIFVWWMLHDMLGDAAMQRAIKAYRADQDRSADYLQKLLESQSHRDLSWFFNDWVYRDRGLPEFTIASAVPRHTLNNDWITDVTVTNDGNAAASVPVAVIAGEQQPTQRVQIGAHQKVLVSLKTSDKPTLARVNGAGVPETDINDDQFEIK
ncbi:MAG TPA: hypothetical protein VGC88_06925, partial [Terriglobales bacterium]